MYVTLQLIKLSLRCVHQTFQQDRGYLEQSDLHSKRADSIPDASECLLLDCAIPYNSSDIRVLNLDGTDMKICEMLHFASDIHIHGQSRLSISITRRQILMLVLLLQRDPGHVRLMSEAECSSAHVAKLDRSASAQLLASTLFKMAIVSSCHSHLFKDFCGLQ